MTFAGIKTYRTKAAGLNWVATVMMAVVTAAVVIFTMTAMPVTAFAAAQAAEPSAGQAGKLVTGDIRLIAGHLPPYSMDSGGVAVGFGAEIARELARRTGISEQVEVMPFPRALMTTMSGHGVIMVAVARTEEREGKMNWVAPIYLDRMVFASLRSQGPVGLGQARKVNRVSVLKDTPMEAFLTQNGYTNLEVVPDMVTAARLLASGRVEAVLAPEALMIHSFRIAGYDPYDLVMGGEIAKIDLNIAASLDVPMETLERLRRALSQIRVSGIYSSIMAKYLLSQTAASPAQ